MPIIIEEYRADESGNNSHISLSGMNLAIAQVRKLAPGKGAIQARDIPLPGLCGTLRKQFAHFICQILGESAIPMGKYSFPEMGIQNPVAP